MKMIHKSAADMADKVFDGLLGRNGDGFSKPKTGKRMFAQGVSPTPIEYLLFMADPKGNPLPTRERSPRGKRKARGIARANARMADYQERLVTYRKEPGIHRLAKKLPYPSWPANLKPSLDEIEAMDMA